MIRKILQDVVPSARRSIRHIPLSGNRHSLSSLERSEEPASPKRLKRYGGRFVRITLSVVALLFLAGAIAASTYRFSSARVTVLSKQSTAAVDTVIQSGKSLQGELPTVIVMSTSTVSEVVPSNNQETVNKKASGTIVIYNDFSSESQRLIKNTRFETPDGKIYRIDISVVVPGQKIEGGKKIPGSVMANVYADVAGPEYNLLLSDLKGDFTIPGFKGTPRYESFYARQKTDITGGFSGIARIVDRAVLDVVTERLEKQAGEALWNSILGSLPRNYTTFKSLFNADYIIHSSDNPSGEGVKVVITAVGGAVTFDTLAFSSAVAKQTLTAYDSEPIVIKNLADLAVTPRISADSTVIQENPLVLAVKGNVHFVWQFDEQELKNKLAGKSKKETDAIMRTYPAIESAEVVLKPSWVMKYPSNTKKIHLEQKLD